MSFESAITLGVTAARLDEAEGLLRLRQPLLLLLLLVEPQPRADDHGAARPRRSSSSTACCDRLVTQAGESSPRSVGTDAQRPRRRRPVCATIAVLDHSFRKPSQRSVSPPTRQRGRARALSSESLVRASSQSCLCSRRRARAAPRAWKQVRAARASARVRVSHRRSRETIITRLAHRSLCSRAADSQAGDDDGRVLRRGVRFAYLVCNWDGERAAARSRAAATREHLRLGVVLKAGE